MKKRLNINIVIGFAFTIIGIILMSNIIYYEYLLPIKLEKETRNITKYIKTNNPIYILDKTKNYNNDYIAVLTIPKINLKKGILKQTSLYNDVDKNIKTIRYKDPLIINSTIILASHSGTSSISYFKNLNKLSIGNNIYLYTSTGTYLYKVIKKYEVLKTGAIEIEDIDGQLVLTTCSMNDKSKQLIIVSKRLR